MSTLYLELAHLLRFFPRLRGLQNTLLLQSRFAYERTGRGPWSDEAPPAWAMKK